MKRLLLISASIFLASLFIQAQDSEDELAGIRFGFHSAGLVKDGEKPDTANSLNNLYIGFFREKKIASLFYWGSGVEYFQNEYKTQIGLKKTQMADCEAQRRASQRHIKNSQEQIDELTSRIELIKKNTSSLIRQRDKFLLDNTSENSILSALLYTNTIQQNITLENTCKKQINDYITRRENEKLKLEELNGKSKRLLEEIKDLEFKKNNVQNVEILQPPTSSQHPVKPRIALNVMLAGVLGFLAMLFLAFFLEYVQTHRAAIWMRKAKIDLPPS